MITLFKIVVFCAGLSIVFCTGSQGIQGENGEIPGIDYLDVVWTMPSQNDSSVNPKYFMFQFNNILGDMSDIQNLITFAPACSIGSITQHMGNSINISVNYNFVYIADTVYTITINNTFSDIYNNKLSEPYVFKFKTE